MTPIDQHLARLARPRLPLVFLPVVMLHRLGALGYAVLLGVWAWNPAAGPTLSTWRWVLLACTGIGGLGAGLEHAWEWNRLYRVADYAARFPVMWVFRGVHMGCLLVLIWTEWKGEGALSIALGTVGVAFVTGILAAVFRDYYLGSHMRQALDTTRAEPAARALP